MCTPVIDKDDTQALALAKTMDASDDPKWSIYPSGLLFRNMVFIYHMVPLSLK